MNVSVELKTENDHFSKVDNKVKNTKTKQSNGNQDSKRTESSSAQEGQMTDDIGRLVTTKNNMVALWNSSFALLFMIVWDVKLISVILFIMLYKKSSNKTNTNVLCHQSWSWIQDGTSHECSQH